MLSVFLGLVLPLVLGSPPPQPRDEKHSILWMAPFFSGGGYATEALDFVAGLHAYTNLSVSLQQHGDGFDKSYVFSLPPATYDLLQTLGSQRMPDRGRRTVCVCHSEPGAWHLSADLPQRYSTSFCPAINTGYAVGRTMFETDRTPSGWPQRLNGMREVWVPTVFQRDIFVRDGVEAKRVFVVGEPVDASVYRPPTEEEMEAEAEAAWADMAEEGVERAAEGAAALFPARMCEQVDSDGRRLEPRVRVQRGTTASCPFRFLSVGKWERRKGFDLLLRALFSAFGRRAGGEAAEEGWARQRHATDAPPVDLSPEAAAVGMAHVEVWVLTSQYHSEGDLQEELVRMLSTELACSDTVTHAEDDVAWSMDGQRVLAQSEYIGSRRACIPPGEGGRPDGAGRGVLPPVRLLSGVSAADMPGVYRHVDVLVQPSRGEGWGRPHVEAMAAGLPVLATNWSGPTAYMTAGNSYLVPVTHMLPIPDGAFRGHLQAEASVEALAGAMRRVVTHPQEVAERGAQARRDMIASYSPSRLAEVVAGHVARINGVLDREEAAAKVAAGAAERDAIEADRKFRALQAEAAAAKAAAAAKRAKAMAEAMAEAKAAEL
jgi:glycosyltransferase involved in cell wall biosynthesis